MSGGDEPEYPVSLNLALTFPHVWPAPSKHVSVSTSSSTLSV
jgi:hypothetical protein